MDSIFADAAEVSSYSRAQALEDGNLVDISEAAREAGITFPVAVTRAVWDGYVVPDKRSEPFGQSIEGRRWDLVWMLKNAIQRSSGGDPILFQVIFVLKQKQRRTITLRSHCGPGDDSAPVITVMLPEES